AASGTTRSIRPKPASPCSPAVTTRCCVPRFRPPSARPCTECQLARAASLQAGDAIVAAPTQGDCAMAGSTSRFPLRTPLLSAALIALLGACSPDRDAEAPPATDPAPAAQADAATPAGDAGAMSPLDGAVGEAKPCNAHAIQALGGQEASETVVAQATAVSGATSLRVIGPDDAGTTDSRIERPTIITVAPGEAKACNADAIQALVGQEASETVVAKATADSGATSVRVLGPDDAATMDFRIDRLTITIDAAGAIQTLNCG